MFPFTAVVKISRNLHVVMILFFFIILFQWIEWRERYCLSSWFVSSWKKSIRHDRLHFEGTSLMFCNICPPWWSQYVTHQVTSHCFSSCNVPESHERIPNLSEKFRNIRISLSCFPLGKIPSFVTCKIFRTSVPGYSCQYCFQCIPVYSSICLSFVLIEVTHHFRRQSQILCWERPSFIIRISWNDLPISE